MSGKKTILLIDDEIDLVDLVKFQLMAKGYHVVVGHDGLEGLEQLRTIKPDLIILDVNMPRMGGLEFLGKISTEHGKPKYPVLVLTARANLEKTFREIAIDGFMPKPFEIDELVKNVDNIISGKNNPVIFLFDIKNNPNALKIKEVLSKERYEVVIIEDFDQLEKETASLRPRFILMEYMQKDVSGEEFIRRIKQNPACQNAPILVYSLSGFKEYGDKSLKAGAVKYLGKPANYDDYVTAVKELELKKG